MSSANIPAFPISEAESQFSGLTKRELFAAMVLQGFAGNPECVGDSTVNVEVAVEWADALLAALSSADTSGAKS